MGTRLKNRSLAYLRRSLSRQETGIHAQLDWAIAEAVRQELSLDATQADLEYMLRHVREPRYKGIFLDDGVTGSDLNRPGFEAFRQTALADPSVSHLLIHLSDRFARPELATQAMLMETELLLAGISVVFSNRISHPRERGRTYIFEDFQLLFEYSQNGKFLMDLSQRVVETQIRLAQGGFWNGGTPPYGFVRILVDAQGNELQELEAGEVVKREGCHVRIKPKDMQKITTWLYIIDLYGNKHWGHLRIANHLNDLGIPSPNAGKIVTRSGKKVVNPGRWWAEVVKRLVRNKAIIGLCVRGKTSSGKHRRFAPDGPRMLEEPDRYGDGGAKKIIVPEGGQVVAAAGYDSLVDHELFRKCENLGEQRGRSLRGIPRAHDPAKYPLSTRIVDVTDDCGATLYGREEFGRRKYECSRYRQSGGRDCARNVIDAENALEFVLQFLRQRTGLAGGRQQLRHRLLAIAQSQELAAPPVQVDERQLTEERIGVLQQELSVIERNLARANSDEAYKAVETQFNQTRSEINRLQGKLMTLSVSKGAMRSSGTEAQIDAAMQLFDELTRIANDGSARQDIGGVLRRLGLMLRLRFMDNPRGRRPQRIVQGGVIAFGLGESPAGCHSGDGGNGSPGAGDGNGGMEPPDAGNSLPSADERHQEGSSFRIETAGKPAVAPVLHDRIHGSACRLLAFACGGRGDLRRRLFVHHTFELQVLGLAGFGILLGVHDNVVLALELALEQFLGKRIFHEVLDGPTQRTCTVVGVRALLDDERLGLVRERQSQAAF